MMKHIHDAQTGQIVERELTADELAQQEVDAIAQAEYEAAIAAKDAIKQSAIEKLAALGLTVDEIKEAFGLEAPQ
jgi:ribosomal protein S11